MVADNIAYCLIHGSAERFFGLTSAERIERGLTRRGITRVIGVEVAATWPGPLLLFRSDYVFDDSLVAGLIERPGTALSTGEHSNSVVCVHSSGPSDRLVCIDMAERNQREPDDPIPVLSPNQMAAVTANSGLRKKHNPLVLNISGHSISEIEEKLFSASYKGVTDFVTKHVWPKPALLATRWCARHAITPNQVTAVSAIMVTLAFVLFWDGWFIAGLAAAWAMCFLDTVDGKLARVCLTSSKWGNVFDHGIDLIHPPFWYWAWHEGTALETVGQEWALWIVIVGYVVGRLQEGWFLWRYKFEIHAWRPIDSWFRQVTARRNPNLAILTLAAIGSQPAAGLMAVAIWTLLSLAFHFGRIFIAEISASRGERPRSWLAMPEGAQNA